jgi:hypothetical protein
MAFIPAIISGLVGLGGALFGEPQTTTTNTSSNSTTNQSASQSGSASSLPNYDPLQLQMRNYLLNQFYQQTNPQAINSLVSNYVGTGTSNINANANGQQQNLNAYLGAQGLSYSPAAASAYGNANAGRVAQINQLQNSAVPLANQIQQQRLTNFAQYVSSLPVGQTSTSQSSSSGTSNTSGTSNSTSTGPNTSLASGISGGASTLAGLYGLGAFSPSDTSGTSSSPVASPSLSSFGTGPNPFSLPGQAPGQSFGSGTLNPFAAGQLTNPTTPAYNQGGGY